MTEKRIDERLLADNLKDLFQGYLFTARTFTEQCIVEKIWGDVFKEIEDSYR